MRRFTFLLLLAVLLHPTFVRAGDDPVAEALEGLAGKEILAYVKELSSDEMQGRKTGFDGGAKAEDWLVSKMLEFGLHPADSAGAYLEPFVFPAANAKAPIAFSVAGKKATYGDDFYELMYSGSGKVSGKVVFCGYGIDRPDLGWDDYAGVDVNGKIVMALRGTPKARAFDLREERYIGYKSATAAKKGAVGFLLVEKENAGSGTIQGRFHSATLPALWVSSAVADRILGTKLAKLKATRDAGDPGASFATETAVALEVTCDFLPNAKGNNAMGFIKGRDPDLSKEHIVIGAHLDHLGVDPLGRVYNGADDNASGTAVMLHLIDVLTRNRWRPKRTIVFIGFGAEEQGLYGSKALAHHWPMHADGIACLLNMDMVGQGEPHVNISGLAAYPAMAQHLASFLGDDVGKTVSLHGRTAPNSDHWPFHETGVPAFFLSTKGPHPNYHTHLDDVVNIKPEVLEAAARTLGTLLVRLGEHPEPLLDPQGLANYVLREGPRFANATLDEVLKTTSFDISSGVSAWIVTVPESVDPQKGWADLDAFAAANAESVLLVRTAADVGRAYQSGKVALVPRLICANEVRDAASANAVASLGYRWVAPFGKERDAAVVASACKAAGLLVDLQGLTAEASVRTRLALGDWPATASGVSPEPRTLGLLAGDDIGLFFAAKLNSAGVCLDGGGLLDVVHAHLSTAGYEAFDARGAVRTQLRAVLGGRLIEWLRRTEK